MADFSINSVMQPADTMITLRERNHPTTASGDDALLGFDDARSIADALKITLLFLAAVVILTWAGVAAAWV